MLKRLDFELFDQVWKEAEASPRHRMHYDLRDSVEEESQRMLNVLEPDTVIPIHRHNDTSEIVAVLRGKVKEILYDDKGVETDCNKQTYFVLFFVKLIVHFAGRFRGSLVPVYY